MTSSFSALCPSHTGWLQTLNCPCPGPFSSAQSWHSSWAARQKHHKRTKHSEWFLTGYSEIYKRIYYWGLGFCLLIDFCSLLFIGQIFCKRGRGDERGRECTQNLLFCWGPEKRFPKFWKLWTETYKPTWNTHIPQMHNHVYATPAVFYTSKCELLCIQKAALVRPPRGMHTEKTHTQLAESCVRLGGRLSVSRENEQRDIQRGSSKELHKGTSTPSPAEPPNVHLKLWNILFCIR